jgi:hypothetical protein
LATQLIQLQGLGRPLGLPSLRSRWLARFRASYFWVERGWKWDRSLRVFNGYYRTARGSFRGEIHQLSSGEYEFYVFSPPPGLERHPNGLCFLYRGTNAYAVNFVDAQKNIDAGIIRIEQILYEAMRL